METGVGSWRNKKNIRQLLEIEQKYPNVKLIVAHIGRAYAPEDMGDAFNELKHTENMLFDFCANTLPEATEKCIEAVGTKRILFGTDMPIAKMRMYRVAKNGDYINVVPRGLYGDITGAAHMQETDEVNVTNFTYEIIRGFKKTADKLGLTKKDIEDIMCNNAINLYILKIHDKLFSYNKLYKYILDNICQYVFNRRKNLNEKESKTLILEALDHLREINSEKDLGAGGELGEILLYLFLAL